MKVYAVEDKLRVEPENEFEARWLQDRFNLTHSGVWTGSQVAFPIKPIVVRALMGEHRSCLELAAVEPD